MVKGIDRINALSTEEAQAGFLRTCGCLRWAAELAAARPFVDEAALFAKAHEAWAKATREELLEAFAHHPRIGDPGSAKTANDAKGHAWASSEQAGVATAEDEVKRRLAEGNRAYDAKFGHVYLVCATGKSAAEMLAILDERIGHTASEELSIAAGEQEKITRIRLERWLSE
jgi:2-oxo-4-hydroxy-4-carboxy-5-ureidoimidazoline decarboxylase